MIAGRNFLLAYLWISISVSVGLFFIPNIAFSTINSTFGISLPIPLGNFWAFVYGSLIGAIVFPPYIFAARAVQEEEL